jgi:hypothetical protein
MSYMHPTFPMSKNHEMHNNPHLTHAHETTHHDPMLRKRVESHSVDGSGPGTMYHAGTV